MFGALGSLPSAPARAAPSPVEELERLRAALGVGAAAARQARRRDRVCVRRQQGAQDALRGCRAPAPSGADTLITTGGVQSNHARVTAAAAAQLGHALHPRRERRAARSADRQRAARSAARRRGPLRRVAGGARAGDGARGRRRAASGRQPFVIPLGASTPLGAAAFVAAIAELRDADRSAGRHRACHLVRRHAGRARRRLRARGLADACDRHQRRRVVAALERTDSGVAPPGSADLLGCRGAPRFARHASTSTIAFVGAGYGMPTATRATRSSWWRAPRRCFSIRPTPPRRWPVSSRACAPGRFRQSTTVLFWHTGGQVALFA